MRVADLNTEYFDAEMRAPLLKRIATETGGKFYTPATASTLAEDVALSKHGVTVVNQMDLWDMPAILPAARRAADGRVVVSQSAGAGMMDMRTPLARRARRSRAVVPGRARARRCRCADAPRHRQRAWRRKEVHAIRSRSISQALADAAQ